jgi:hypothetical protein
VSVTAALYQHWSYRNKTAQNPFSLSFFSGTRYRKKMFSISIHNVKINPEMNEQKKHKNHKKIKKIQNPQ